MDAGDTECAKALLAQDERVENGRGLPDMTAMRTQVEFFSFVRIFYVFPPHFDPSLFIYTFESHPDYLRIYIYLCVHSFANISVSGRSLFVSLSSLLFYAKLI
jgi:hypothetical protein